MPEFSYLDATRSAGFDFSPLSRAGEITAAAGRDAGESIREAAKAILATKQAQKDRDLQERMRTQDRAASLMTHFLGEMGANRRSSAQIGAQRAMNAEDNAAAMAREVVGNAAVTARNREDNFVRLQVIREARAAEEAKVAQARANFAGAMEAATRMASEKDYSPIVPHKLRPVDTDQALGSIFGQGGEPALVRHYRSKGMDEAQAGQAAKAALQAKFYEYVDPGRSSRIFGILADKFGPEAAEAAMNSRFGSYKYQGAQELEEAVRGDSAASMGQQFPARTGTTQEPRIEFGPINDPDRSNLNAGGDWRQATPDQRATVDYYASMLAKDDPRLRGDPSYIPEGEIEKVTEEMRKKFLTAKGWRNLDPEPSDAAMIDALQGSGMYGNPDGSGRPQDVPPSIQKLDQGIREDYLDALRAGDVKRAREILMGKPSAPKPPTPAEKKLQDYQQQQKLMRTGRP